MSRATNEPILTDINNRIAQIIDGFTNIKTDRVVKFFTYGIETDEISHTVKPIPIEEKDSSVKRTKSWQIIGDPTLRNLTEDQDIFNSKINFAGVRTVADIEMVVNKSKDLVARFARIADAEFVTEPLKVIQNNMKQIHYFLQDAHKLTENEENRVNEVNTIFRQLRGYHLVCKHPFFWSFQQFKWVTGLNETLVNAINNWLITSTGGPPEGYILKYRASVDGFRANIFHAKCDTVPRLLIIIRSATNYMFGGFTSVAFTAGGPNQYVASDDNQSFLFTLTNPHGLVPTMYTLKSASHTIYSRADYGPTFGSGHDLHICNNSNTATGSYCHLSSGYNDTTGKGDASFTGERVLGVIADIFVFEV